MRYYDTYTSPIGELYIVESNHKICAISFTVDSNMERKETAVIKETKQQLQEYFLGIRKKFTMPLITNGSDFQEKTWQALLQIPYGKTWTYKQLAVAVGNEKASRAVGNANNKNPIAIVIPCHRVIGSSGKLVGYAGGLDKKEQLLALEEANR